MYVVIFVHFNDQVLHIVLKITKTNLLYYTACQLVCMLHTSNVIVVSDNKLMYFQVW